MNVSFAFAAIQVKGRTHSIRKNKIIMPRPSIILVRVNSSKKKFNNTSPAYSESDLFLYPSLRAIVNVAVMH